jgi:hypothetical protein
MTAINSQKFQHLMANAIEMAKDSLMAQQHGAILIPRNGKYIIGSACNTAERNCIRGSCRRQGLHAEVACIMGSTMRKQQFKRGLRATANYKNRSRARPYFERGGEEGGYIDGKDRNRGQKE